MSIDHLMVMDFEFPRPMTTTGFCSPLSLSNGQCRDRLYPVFCSAASIAWFKRAVFRLNTGKKRSRFASDPGIQAICEATHLKSRDEEKGGDELVLSLFRLDSVVCESWDKSVWV
ncbi:hypothetical protein CORC01_01184 [Colletotrichum orchidophilum]|uniref:Uncharacterized protein n=1 Tax=Colletotrichum orchidophilum TaxID=1209926 RepID=A0A1G4BQ63_9PEZI|nr:uncharacterized protein CORC01_01184 [Colletotrichum orchidophilum]OHF03465.1 hypothetical protein CORC01_01184 [Colletotrichum orchidophilum]